MGALKGSVTYLRFLVEGTAPNTRTMEQAIEARRFMPLHPDADATEQAGWVATETPFADEASIGRDAFMFGSLVVLTYREDKYAIPRAALVKALDARLARIAAEEEDGAQKVKRRAFRKAVEAAVLVELKHKTIPRTALVDLAWDTQTNALRVFARGARAKERVVALFERTFGVRAELATFAGRAFALDLNDRARSVLEQLKPGPLFADDVDTTDRSAA